MKAWIYTVLILTAAFGVSCTRETLDYRKQEGYVHLTLTWEEGFEPSGSRFYFFPKSGAAVLSYDCPAEGFHGVLPTGSYYLLVLNNDFSNLGVRNTEDLEHSELYVLPEASGRAQRFIRQADEIAYATELNESALLEVPYRDTVRVTASPQSCVKHVRLRFEVLPPTHFTHCSGALSGVSPSVHFASAESAVESAAVHFEAVSGETADLFLADITVLDLVHPDDTQGTHLLEAVFTDAAGGEYPLHVDLTESVLESFTQQGELPEEIVLTIRIAQIDGELTATVQPWDQGGTGGGSM